MAGIYIHIPFCLQRCNYCDFYKTTQLDKKPELINALASEIEIRAESFNHNDINTIYFGGGTPSVLDNEELEYLLGAVFSNYNVMDDAEITLEANPDDLTKEKIKQLSELPINRLSIGIQSFDDEMLKLMNRRHSSAEAIECIKNAQNAGFDNISTDLIYGLPGLSTEAWNNNLNKMAELNIQHLSAYHLTYEDGTKFSTFLKKGEIEAVSEEESVMQFKSLIDWAKKEGFEHYEISNFAKPGLYSKHNTSYWQQKKYLGIGPSAHSYDLRNRWWNVSSLNKYLKGVESGEPESELENLSVKDKFNEYLMTSLRTKWGIDKEYILDNFGESMANMLNAAVESFIDDELIREESNHYILTDAGIFISDTILEELIFV